MVSRISGLCVVVVVLQGSGCGDDGGATGGTPGETGSASTGEGTSDAPTSGPGTGPVTTVASTDVGSTGEDPTGSQGSTGRDPTGTGGATTADSGATAGTTEASTAATEGGSTGETGEGEGSTGEAPLCPLALMHAPCDDVSDDPLHAIGLNCAVLGAPWVDKTNAVAVDKIEFVAAPEQDGRRPWQVARAYGTFVDPDTQEPFWSAREGDKILLLSSGLLPKPDADGVVIVPAGEVYNDVGDGKWDEDAMPPPMSPAQGSPDPQGFKDCDGKGDCSNTLAAQWELGGGDPNDRLWLRFELTAPSLMAGDIADANGYSFDFAFFSAEFPEWIDTPFNDIFVVWQSSEKYTGNVTFINGQPLTVTALWPIDYQGECNLFDPNCVGEAPQLAGTGHSKDGGATGWYRATGGVQPGETFGLAFAIFDMGDSTYDTTAVVDRWLWDCEGCVPNDVRSCGIEPQ